MLIPFAVVKGNVVSFEALKAGGNGLSTPSLSHRHGPIQRAADSPCGDRPQPGENSRKPLDGRPHLPIK
jgi:hypothetical protein